MPEVPPDAVTRFLQNWVQGDTQALRELLPIVYQELRRLASHHLLSERSDHTLQSTALVNEALLRLQASRVGRVADITALSFPPYHDDQFRGADHEYPIEEAVTSPSCFDLPVSCHRTWRHTVADYSEHP
jgi:ECF sigma factor